MKKELFSLMLIALCFIVSLNAQTKFEKGLYINNSGETFEGLIKNVDWLNAPKKIDFKADENQESISLDICEVAYFEVGAYKFKRFTVPYDKSYGEKSNPGEGREPIYEDKIVFLRLLVDGHVDLYKLGSQNRFYFIKGNDSIQHLIYKEYVVNNKLRSNDSYKSQLFNVLDCNDILVEDIQNLSFTTKYLMEVFSKYNSCRGEVFYEFRESRKKQIFHLSVQPGIRFAQVNTISRKLDFLDVKYDWKPSFSVTTELEYMMPFNKNKWSVYTQLVYQSYDNEHQNDNLSSSSIYYTTVADYQSIEVNLGVRYYMYFSEKSNISLNTNATLLDFPINSKINSVEVNSAINFYFGLAYLHGNKYGAAIGFSTNRPVLAYNTEYSGVYRYFDIRLSYRIF